MTVIDVELGYERTVDRRLVHRWAVSEVFLTDVQACGQDRFIAAAQWPTSHTYYGDGEPESAVDTMFLLESFRQAATWIAHEALAVPRDAAFLVSSWSLASIAADPVALDGRPGRLRIEVDVTDLIERAGQVRGASFAGTLSTGDASLAAPLAETTVSARYIPAEEAAAMRSYHRGSPPPSSTALPALPPGRPAAPQAVGRRNPENVVLYDVSTHSAGTQARLGTRPAHKGFYDHPQDHYPAMILFEGARQLVLAHLNARRPGRHRIAGLSGRFHYFAELDAPVTLACAATGPQAATEVLFMQNDRVVAEIEAHPILGGDHG